MTIMTRMVATETSLCCLLQEMGMTVASLVFLLISMNIRRFKPSKKMKGATLKHTATIVDILNKIKILFFPFPLMYV